MLYINVLRTGPELEPVWLLVQGSTGQTGSTVIEPDNKYFNKYNLFVPKIYNKKTRDPLKNLGSKLK
jgi:hypothetical protein